LNSIFFLEDEIDQRSINEQREEGKEYLEIHKSVWVKKLKKK
jgi:hypothetical protein